MQRILNNWFLQISLVPLLLSFTLVVPLAGQDSSQGNGSPGTPAELIEEIHNATLVVRLPEFNNKIEYAQKRLLEGKSVAFASELLAESLMERAILYDGYITAFQQNYTFSKVAFIFGKNLQDFLDGKAPALEADLSTPAEIDPKETLFIVTLDNVDGVDARELNVRDRNLNILPAPVPNGFISGGMGGLLSWFGDSHSAESQVNRMNTKFWRYYSRTAAERAMMSK